MKTLSLARPLILMVVGLPGAGKSFFASQFSETFGVPHVSSDRIRFELFSEPQYSTQEQELINRLRYHMIEECLKTKRSLLIDGECDSRAERQKLEQLAKKHGYDTLIVWVQTDQPTAQQRATKRNPKRSGDAFNTSLSPSQFLAFAKKIDPPMREQHLVISGKHAYSTQAKMVLRKLAAPHAEEANQVHKQESKELRQRPLPTTEPHRRSVIIR